MSVKPGEQTLDDWLKENMPEIRAMQEFATADLSDEPGKLSIELSRAQRDFARAGFLLADAESFVVKAEAAAYVEVRREQPDLVARERLSIVKAQIADVVRLRDNLNTIVQALRSRCFSIMNLNRTIAPAGGGYPNN